MIQSQEKKKQTMYSISYIDPSMKFNCRCVWMSVNVNKEIKRDWREVARRERGDTEEVNVLKIILFKNEIMLCATILSNTLHINLKVIQGMGEDK